MSELINRLTNIINNSANCNRTLDDVIRYYELTINKFEFLLLNNFKNVFSNEDKRFNNKPNSIKFEMLANLYKELALVVSLKLISNSCISNLGKFNNQNLVNRPSGKFRYDVASGFRLNTQSIPLINFRIFSQTEIDNLQLNILSEVETIFNQFDVHACNVNKHNYLLPKGGNYLCPGCYYQQNTSKSTFELPSEFQKISNWINTSMLSQDLMEYLNTTLIRSKESTMWVTYPKN